MKFVCTRDNLVKGVSIVARAVPSRTTMPILECILIDATGRDIVLMANDMELGIKTVIEGSVLEHGRIAIDARFFFEIIRKLPDSDVTIESDNDYRTSIVSEYAHFHIVGKSADDFTEIPSVEKKDALLMSQFTLRDIVRQTIFSIADNENNPVMTGELFEVHGNRMRLVSLDGHRISIRNVELKDNYGDYKVIVPGKAMQEISRILQGGVDDEVFIYISDNYILFEFDRTSVVSRLVEGEYFAIEHMITSSYETKVIVNKQVLTDCLDRSTLLIREGEKKPFIMDIKDGNMRVLMNTYAGSMEESIQITKEGRDIMIGFNPKFFLEALRVIDDEEVALYLMNPKAPCFIRDDAENYNYMILPVNFSRL